ncbi:MAG: hypothetical protein ACRC63_01350, partial [Metamycoplasmataceae bacterium]
IIINNVDSVKELRTLEIRSLLETQPLTSAILNRLSISVPDGIQLYKVTFTNININNLFQITFTITYNGVSQSNSSFLNATPADDDILGVLEISNNEILINDSRDTIRAKLSQPMSLELLTSLSVIDIPVGIDVTKISFSNINISNPFRVTFNFTYNLTTKTTTSWLTTKATDSEAANAITITNPDILKIESNIFIKSLLEGQHTPNTFKTLGIYFPDGGNISLVSFTNININDPYKISFTINYNNVPKLITDFLISTPPQDIANEITISNPDILVSDNVNFIENLLTTKPMTKEILNELSIILPEDIPANRITFTEINKNDLFRITFRINYNGVGKTDLSFLNTTPTDLDIANALVINDVNVLNKKDVHFVEELLKTSPMTKEILDQLSISLPPNVEVHKITFTKINISDPSKITFFINYNGVVSINESFLNTNKSSASNTVVIVSILIPISAILIAGIIGAYFWNKKKNDSGKGGPKQPLSKKIQMKKPEVKKPEVKKPEVKKPEVKKPEVKKIDTVGSEIKQINLQKQDVNAPQINIQKTTASKGNILPSNTSNIKKPEVKKPEVKKPESRNTYEEYFRAQMIDLTNQKLNINSQQKSNNQNYQWYDNQVNADWYAEQANSEWYYDPNNQEWYLEQANDQLYSFNPQQNQNDFKQNVNNNSNQDDWTDNRWYSNQANTGHWENGNWHENNKQQKGPKIKQNPNWNLVHTRDNFQFNNTKMINQTKNPTINKKKSKPSIDDWTNIIDMIEK